MQTRHCPNVRKCRVKLQPALLRQDFRLRRNDAVWTIRDCTGFRVCRSGAWILRPTNNRPSEKQILFFRRPVAVCAGVVAVGRILVSDISPQGKTATPKPDRRIQESDPRLFRRLGRQRTRTRLAPRPTSIGRICVVGLTIRKTGGGFRKTFLL